MLDDYANQSLTWVHVLTLNEYNEIATSTTTTIKGRKDTGLKLICNAQGQEILSTAYVATKSAITVNDNIDGKLVVSSEPAIDLDGRVLFWEVYLK